MGKGRQIKRAAALVLMVCLCIGGIFTGPDAVKAAEPSTFFNSGVEQAKAGGTYFYRLTLNRTMTVGILVYDMEQMNVNFKVFAGNNTKASPVHEETIPPYVWIFDYNNGAYFAQTPPTLDPGIYTVQITFEKETPYILKFSIDNDQMEGKTDPSLGPNSGQKLDGDPVGETNTAPGSDQNAGTESGTGSSTDTGSPTDTGSSAGTGNSASTPAKLSRTSVTLTDGFETALKVTNASGTVSWSTSNEYVADVSSDGTVTAKRAGAATITARTKDGQKLTCKVTVKANEYKETKVKVQKVPKKDCFVQVYRAYYDKNGNLVLQCRAANNTGSKITALKNLKITLKSDSGKTIGTYQVKTKKLAVAAGKTKDFQVTIKKANLKDKNANLCKSSCSVSSKF